MYFSSSVAFTDTYDWNINAYMKFLAEKFHFNFISKLSNFFM